MSEDRTVLIRDLSAQLAACKGWMKFLGVVFIVQGVLTALSIIGILIAWLPIWIGVLLLQAGSAVEQAHASGDEAAFRLGMDKLRSYFVILGVLALIGIVLTVLMLLFYGAVIAAMVAGGLH